MKFDDSFDVILVSCVINRVLCTDNCSKIEGSKATAKLASELLRSFISQQRLPHSNQAAALIDAVKAVGEKLIAAKPVGMLIPLSDHFFVFLPPFLLLLCYFCLELCVYVVISIYMYLDDSHATRKMMCRFGNDRGGELV